MVILLMKIVTKPSQGQATLKSSVDIFVRFIRRTGLAMDEPKHTVGCEPDVVSLCPFHICTTIGDIGSEHCPKIGHLLATFALGEAFGIDSASFCLRVKELTPRVEVYDQQAPVHRLLVAAETALGAFVFPGGGGATATHGGALQRAVSAGPEHPGVWEEGLRGLLR